LNIQIIPIEDSVKLKMKQIRDMG